MHETDKIQVGSLDLYQKMWMMLRWMLFDSSSITAYQKIPIKHDWNG